MASDPSETGAGTVESLKGVSVASREEDCAKILEKNIKKHKERLVNSGQKKYVDPLATTSGLVQKLEPLA